MVEIVLNEVQGGSDIRLDESCGKADNLRICQRLRVDADDTRIAHRPGLTGEATWPDTYNSAANIQKGDVTSALNRSRRRRQEGWTIERISLTPFIKGTRSKVGRSSLMVVGYEV